MAQLTRDATVPIHAGEYAVTMLCSTTVISIYTFKKVTWWFVLGGRAAYVRTAGIRTDGRLLDSFSSLWAAFTLTVHIIINALYNERVNGKEEHAT